MPLRGHTALPLHTIIRGINKSWSWWKLAEDRPVLQVTEPSGTITTPLDTCRGLDLEGLSVKQLIVKSPLRWLGVLVSRVTLMSLRQIPDSTTWAPEHQST